MKADREGDQIPPPPASNLHALTAPSTSIPHNVTSSPRFSLVDAISPHTSPPLSPLACRLACLQYGAPHARLPYFVCPDYPAWGEVEVYCIHMPQQHGETAPKGTDASEGGAVAAAWPVYEEGSGTLLPPVLEGPFACNDVEAMEALSTQDSVHYVYVLRKPCS